MWGHDFRPDYLFIRRAPRGARRAGDPRDDRDGDAGDGARHRDSARPRRSRSSARASMRPNLRYDVEEVAQRGGPARDPRRAAARAARRLGDRLRALAPLDCEELARVLRGHGLRSRALPRRARGRGAHARPGRLHRRTDPGRRRHDRVRDGHRQAGRAARLPLQLPGLARELRADGRARRPRRRAERDAPAREPERRDRAAPVRGRRTCRRRRAPARLPRAARRPAGSSTRTSSPRWPDRDARVLVGMLEQAGLVRRGFDDGPAMRIELPAAPGRRARARRRAARSRTRSWPSRAPTASSRFAETRRVPARAGGRALRRGASTALRCVRRLRRRRRAGRVDLEPAAAAARRRRRGDRRRGRVADVAARATEPRRDAARLAEGAAVGAALARLRLLAAATDADVRRWVQLARELGRARRGRRRPTASASCTPIRARRAAARSGRAAPPTSTRSSSTRLRSWRLERSREDACPHTSSSTTRRCASSPPLSPQTLRRARRREGLRPGEARALRRRRARRPRRLVVAPCLPRIAGAA